VVLPASGCEIIAKVRRREIGSANFDGARPALGVGAFIFRGETFWREARAFFAPSYPDPRLVARGPAPPAGGADLKFRLCAGSGCSPLILSALNSVLSSLAAHRSVTDAFRLVEIDEEKGVPTKRQQSA